MASGERISASKLSMSSAAERSVSVSVLYWGHKSRHVGILSRKQTVNVVSPAENLVFLRDLHDIKLTLKLKHEALGKRRQYLQLLDHVRSRQANMLQVCRCS